MANGSLQIPGVEVLDLEELQQIDIEELTGEPPTNGSCCSLLFGGCSCKPT